MSEESKTRESGGPPIAKKKGSTRPHHVGATGLFVLHDVTEDASSSPPPGEKRPNDPDVATVTGQDRQGGKDRGEHHERLCGNSSDARQDEASDEPHRVDLLYWYVHNDSP